MISCNIDCKENSSLNSSCPPLFNVKTLKFLFKNIVTGGWYGAIKNLASDYQIKCLKNKKNILQKNIETTSRQWELFNEKIIHLKKQSLESEVDIQLLHQRCTDLNKQDLLASEQTPFHSKLFILIFIVKNVIANCLTVGFYGTYQAHLLSKRLIKYENKNDLLIKQQNQTTQERINSLLLLKQNHQIQATDQGKLYQENQQLNQRLIELERLEKETLLAHAQHEKDAQKILTLNHQIDDLNRDKQELEINNSSQNKQLTKLIKNSKRLTEEVSQRRVDQKELNKLKNNLKNRPLIEKLIPRLGPMDVPYLKREEDGEISGAFGVDELRETNVHLWSDYAKRYNHLKTAEEVISHAFDFIAKSLFTQAKTKEKYQLTNSYLTIDTLGFLVIYRLMALDLLKGAKLKSRGCQGGYELKINSSDVIMLPSCPEKVLRLLPDGNNTPQLAIHYLQKDDFTPHESIGPAVDPLSAKWILAQLTAPEQAYLETLLASPIIEDTHPDHQQLVAFLQSNHPHVALVKTACDLIIDLAEAFKNQFGQSIIVRQWQHLIAQKLISDEDIAIYVKPEEDRSSILKIKDNREVPFVKWILQPRLLESNFSETFQFSMLRYQSVLENLTPDLLLHTLNPNEKIAELNLATIDDYYYTSHNMLKIYDKNQHCLFSNLLTILMSDPAEVTANNVLKLKRAMAHYLEDNPHQFEESIQSEHHCSVNYYIKWLKEEEKEDYFSIRLDNLSPLEIKIAAFTFGVRIAVFPLNLERQVLKGVGDEQGRVMPEKSFYESWVGPYTKELLIMGCARGNSSQSGSYYGLFPRLDLNKITDHEVLANAQQIVAYWEAMEQRRNELDN
jgi:hypothetical protein